MAVFPITRLRRLRENPKVRQLVRETRVSVEDLVMPIFIFPGKKQKRSIKSMPGIFQLSPDLALKECENLLKIGISAVLLFGIPASKDPNATSGYAEDGVIQQTLQLIKKKLPEMLLICDVCLCDYTDHGHCGIVREEAGKKFIDNDPSLEVLSHIAGSMARAGADVIAPSDMMDGRVQVIRDELDAAGFKHLPILSYAVKYASSFYGPFREALQNQPAFGDRKSYQMDPANSREALLEAEQDIAEGADILMVKPALPYLDVLTKLRQEFSVPLAAYQVSGEYSMIKLAAQHGIGEGRSMVLESWTAMKRAGADIIVSYFARDYGKYL